MISIATSATASAREAASAATSALAAASAAAWIAANAASRSTSPSAPSAPSYEPDSPTISSPVGVSPIISSPVGVSPISSTSASPAAASASDDLDGFRLDGLGIDRLDLGLDGLRLVDGLDPRLDGFDLLAAASAAAATIESNDGGSGRRSAIVANWVGSSSARRRSKNVAMSASNPATVAWTASISRSITAACCSTSRLETGLALADLAFGLFADPGDLGLGPLADRGDVVVGDRGGGRLPRSRTGRGSARCGSWRRPGAGSARSRGRPRPRSASPSSGRRGTCSASCRCDSARQPRPARRGIGLIHARFGLGFHRGFGDGVGGLPGRRGLGLGLAGSVSSRGAEPFVGQPSVAACSVGWAVASAAPQRSRAARSGDSVAGDRSSTEAGIRLGRRSWPCCVCLSRWR